MHIEGEFLVKASREKLCGFVLDPAKFPLCIPGFQEVKAVSPDDFTVLIKGGSEYVKGSFAIRIIVQEKNPPVSASLLVKGVGRGSKVDVDLSVSFDEAGNKSSTVRWRAEVKLEGRLASIGAEKAANGTERLISELFKCVRVELEEKAPFIAGKSNSAERGAAKPGIRT